ncbi:MAG: acyl carrier protein [Saprospiraceae bacterium]
MTKSQIQKEITNILVQMGVPASSILANASYYKDLGLDSLDFSELIMECELRLNLETSCLEVENIRTVQDTVEYASQILKCKTN